MPPTSSSQAAPEPDGGDNESAQATSGNCVRRSLLEKFFQYKTNRSAELLSLSTSLPTYFRASLHLRHALLVVIPTFFYIVADQLFERFGNSNIKIPRNIGGGDLIAEASGRYNFVAIYMIYILISAGTATYFAIDVRKHLRGSSIFSIILMSTIMGSTIYYFVIVGPWAIGSPHTYYFIDRKLFEQALLASALPLLPQVGMLKAFNLLISIGQGAVFIAVISVICGSFSTLGYPYDAKLSNVKKARFLAWQVRRLKIYLYLSALVLVSGVIVIRSWMLWPSFIVSSENQSAFRLLVDSICTTFGVGYSIVLSAYYIPISNILSRRASHLAHEVLSVQARYTSPEVDKWKTEQGLLVHDLTSYKTIAALIAPILAGPISSYVTWLSSH